MTMPNDGRNTYLPRNIWGEPLAGVVPAGIQTDYTEELRRRQEQLEQEAAHQQAMRRAWEEQYRREQQAQRRAEDLLVSLLSPEQKATYLDKDQRWFEVTGSQGGVYRLHRFTQQNVVQLDPATRAIQARLCIVLKDRVPVGDLLIAQLLLLRSDEKMFRKIARISRERA